MRIAHLLSFVGGVVLGLAFVKLWNVDFVLLSAGLSLSVAGFITAYRAH